MNKRLLLLLGGMLFSTWMCGAMEKESEYQRSIVQSSTSQSLDMKRYQSLTLRTCAMNTAIKHFLPPLVLPIEFDAQGILRDLSVIKKDFDAIKKWIKDNQDHRSAAQYISSCALARKYFEMNDISYGTWVSSNNMIKKLIKLIAYGIVCLYLEKKDQSRILVDSLGQYEFDRYYNRGVFKTSDFFGLQKIEQYRSQHFFLRCNYCENFRIILSALSIFRNLTELNLARNALTIIPGSVFSLMNLEKLNLASNKLTSIPYAISRLTNLNELDFSFNQLVFTFAYSLFLMTTLTALDLSQNNLTEIPDIVALLTNLESLRLRDNQISTLPTDISTLCKLTTLDLYDNPIVSLPMKMLNMTNIIRLHFGTEWYLCHWYQYKSSVQQLHRVCPKLFKNQSEDVSSIIFWRLKLLCLGVLFSGLSVFSES